MTEFLTLLSVLASFLKTSPKLSLNGNSSPNGLGHSLTLGVNSSLRVIGVGFQLYGQLKKSPHDVMGVLGSSAVSMVSQMVTYLICGLRKEFFKRVQARFR